MQAHSAHLHALAFQDICPHEEGVDASAVSTHQGVPQAPAQVAHGQQGGASVRGLQAGGGKRGQMAVGGRAAGRQGGNE